MSSAATTCSTDVKKDIEFLVNSYPVIDKKLYEELQELQSIDLENESDHNPMKLQCTLLQYGALDESKKLQVEELLHLLLDSKGENFVVNSKTIHGKNILLLAIEWNASLELIEKIINVGKRGVLEKTGGTSALLHACYCKASYEIIAKLTDVCNSSDVMESNFFGNIIHNALHQVDDGSDFARKESYSCKDEKVIDINVLKHLIYVGGRDLLLKMNGKGQTPLHLACANNLPLFIIDTLIEFGGKQLLFRKTNTDNISDDESDSSDSDFVMDIPQDTALHVACHTQASQQIIEKLIDLGGEELVLKADPEGYSALHLTCEQLINPHVSHSNNMTELGVVKKLLAIGGKELVMMKTEKDNRTALHLEMSKVGSSREVVEELLSVGGRELLFERDSERINAMHLLVYKEDPSLLDLYHLLKSVGGKKLLLQKDRCGRNTLSYYIQFLQFGKGNLTKAALNLMSPLIEDGGRGLVLSQDKFGNNALHYFCHFWTCIDSPLYQHLPLSLIEKLIEVGGTEILVAKNKKGLSPLYRCIRSYSKIANQQLFKELRSDRFSSFSSAFSEDLTDDKTGATSSTDLHVTIFSKLVEKGIELGIGDEHSVGGLFDLELMAENEREMSNLWTHWNHLISRSLQEHPLGPSLPILHGAIQCEAPKNILKDIIRCFPTCIMKRDNHQMLPLQLAISNSLEWNSGLEIILKATAEAQGRLMINVAAENNLQWTDGIEMVVISDSKIKDEQDIETGLFPFMLAASNGGYNIDTIYELMRRSPELLQTFCGS